VSALVAVVDDDGEMLVLLQRVLIHAGFRVQGYATPGRFFDGVTKTRPDLCLIDIQLRGMDGREIVRVLRANPETRALPVILMSAIATSAADFTRGLDGGADECFAKPLDLELLVARIRNLLARASGAATPPPAEVIRWRDLEVEPDGHRLALRGKEISLTHLEFKLLLAFLRQPNRVLPRVWLLQNVWQSSSAVTTRTVDKHVETLRKKVPPLADRLETVVGVGYLFRP
jgi:DNA-binding response OmpR family regulator